MTTTTLTWRSLEPGDVPALVDLLADVETTDRTGEHYDAADVALEIDGADLERDTVAVLDGGRLVAFGLVRGSPQAGDTHHVRVWGAVRPADRGRGTGRALLARQLAQAAALHARTHPGTRGLAEAWVPDGLTAAVALVRRAGLEETRRWFVMRHELADLPAVGDTGLQVLPYDPALDDAVRRARNEAFAEHYGVPPRTEAEWRQFFTGAHWFRPALSFVALDGGEVAGYLLTTEYAADAAADGLRTAWVANVGTRRAWRGRGVASALLATALRAHAAAGFDRTELEVDTVNPTGALAVYERLGFRTVSTATTWGRPLPA